MFRKPTMIDFKGAHYPREVILYAAFFYVRCGVSYRDFEENMEEYFPSMILIFEAIRSLHLQTMNEEHQLQAYAANNVIVDAEEDRISGGLKKNLEETIDIDEDV